MTDQFHSNSKTVLVCQGHTCSLSGSAQVLFTFRVNSPPEFEVTGCGCLGQCGNGPMVLILPEETWYSGVSCAVATMIIKQHLRWGKPVVNMLYRKFHPLPSYETKKAATYFFSWLIAVSAILVLISTIVWVLSLKQY